MLTFEEIKKHGKLSRGVVINGREHPIHETFLSTKTWKEHPIGLQDMWKYRYLWVAEMIPPNYWNMGDQKVLCFQTWAKYGFYGASHNVWVAYTEADFNRFLALNEDKFYFHVDCIGCYTVNGIWYYGKDRVSLAWRETYQMRRGPEYWYDEARP